MSVNVPSGYKKTKVGVIPEDWGVVKLGDICKFQQGVQVDIELQATKPKDGYIKFLRIENYTQLSQDFRYVPTESTFGKTISENEIAIVRYGATAGFIARGFSGVLANNLFKLIFDENILYSEYLYCYLTSNRVFNFFQSEMAGGAMPALSFGIVKVLNIHLPPLKEQQKIAQILTNWDDAISKQETLIEAKEKLKKGLMWKLLSGKVRFGEFSDEWKEVRFNDVFERVTRKNTINNTNVLTISAQHGLINQEHFFNKSIASKDLSGYILLKKGEFAYNKSYSNGYPMGAIKRLTKYGQGVLSNLYIYFTIKDGNADFYEHYFEAGLLNKEIYKIAQEGARNHGLLNMSVKEFFHDIHILKPPIKEQKKIAQVLTQADKEIDLLKNELEVLKEQKRGLMQRLLSGEIRTNKIREKENG